MALSEQFVDNGGGLFVGEGELLAVSLVGEFFVVEPEELEERGVVIVMGDDAFDRAVTPFVGFAMDVSAFESATGEPHAESVSIVVAAALFAASVVLQNGQPAHFTAPMNDGAIEEAQCPQIVHERSGRAIDGLTIFRQSFDEAAVVIPGLTDVEHLHEANAALHEPARDQTARPVIAGNFLIDAVELLGSRGFLGDVESLFGGDLHPGSEFVTGDAGFEIQFSGMGGEMFAIDRLNEVKLAGLGGAE